MATRRTARKTEGVSNATRVVSVIMGILLIGLGGISALVTIVGIGESSGDEIFLVLFLAALTALQIGSGSLLIMYAQRERQRAAEEARPRRRADEDEGEDEDEDEDGRPRHRRRSHEQVISREQIAGPQQGRAASEVVPQAVPVATVATVATTATVASAPNGHAAQEADATSAASLDPGPARFAPKRKATDDEGRGSDTAQGTAPSTEDVAGLVVRSDNLFATLKDLMRHESSQPGGAPTAHRHLVSMLKAAGLEQWDDAPVCEAGRLSRNHHFWIRLATDGLSPDDYDRLLGVEAALSLNQDLPEARTLDRDDPATILAVEALMRRLPSQQIPLVDLSESLGVAYPGMGAEDTPGEWYLRASLVSAAECAVTPFRVVYNMRCHVAAGIAALSLEIPRPRCMAVLTSDELCMSAARAYALRLAALLGGQALSLDDRIKRVVINCHEQGSTDTLLSVNFDRELQQRLKPVLSSDEIDRQGFPADPAIRASFDEQGWFQPVEPHLTLDDPVVSPRERFRYPELDTRPATQRLANFTGARTISDLGINENAPRIAAWEQLAEQGWESTEAAVSALMALREREPDIHVAEACTRTANALVSGAVDVRDRDALQKIFIAGSSLEQAVARAEVALSGEGPEDPEAALAALGEALRPIEALGPYIDDETTIYRYFGSIAERIRFNLDVDDHQREVRLVPDAYYNALSSASVAHAMLGHAAEAMRYAEEMIRIAPVSIHAAMRKVRLLENDARVFEAADLIRSVLRYASTPRDAAICHYRLAYMEWKLGREDLGVACYQRSLAWDTEMSAQAREELADLLESNQHLKRLSDDEVFSLLAQEGIPLGCDAADRRRLSAAAALCCDEGVFWAARPLVGVLFGIEGDDVMMGVYRSMEPVLP